MLRLKGKLIELAEPDENGYLHVKNIWEDEETMRDVGGTYPINHGRYKIWYDKMFVAGKDRNAYFLIYENGSGACVGEVSFHDLNSKTGAAMFNVKIRYAYRGRGYGRESVELMLKYFFEKRQGQVMRDLLWAGNPAGLRMLLKYGFREVERSEKGILIEIRKEQWEKARRNEE